MSIDVLRQFVDLALPKPCEFGEENFAGDPLVRAFCDRLSEANQLELHYFVAWACPPDVTVIRSSAGSAVVRSERLDTLLVEYYRFQCLHPTWADDLTRHITASAVLRWMCELLIGYRHPGLALLAQRLRPALPGLRLTNPFRDETLDSIPKLQRVALQCVCLAHEMGHILHPRRPEATIDDIFDGLPLTAHLEWGDRECGYSEDVRLALSQLWRQSLDGPTLVAEIEADMFAFSSVVEFLCNTLSYPLEHSIRAALRSFEAQFFVCACKNTCRLLVDSHKRGMRKGDFLVSDYLLGAEYLVRARAIARRAGIAWAFSAQPNAAPGTRDYESYVKRIDSMIIEVQPFTQLASEMLTRSAHAIFDHIESQANKGNTTWPTEEFKRLASDSDLRSDLFEILVAFGCPGGVNVRTYLEGMLNSTQHA